MTATAVLPDAPGLQAGVHFDGSEQAAPFPAAGVEEAVALVVDFEPSGHEANGQCVGSGQFAVADVFAATGLAGVAWRFASAVEPVASAKAAASAINGRMRFIDSSCQMSTASGRGGSPAA